MKKGQASTEYLVILAVVIIVALVVVAVLGGFIDIGSSATEQTAKTYWRTSDLGLLNWKVDGTGADSQFIIRNNLDYKVKLSNLSIDGTELTDARGKTLSPGKTAIVTGDLSSKCSTGDDFSLSVVFDYNDTDHGMTGLKFTGTKDIAGKCV